MIKKTKTIRTLAIGALFATALTLTGCTKDELATDPTAGGGNGPLSITTIGIEGAVETRAAIAEGTFAGSATPGPNEVKTAFAIGDMVTINATAADENGSNENSGALTVTLQSDSSWALSNDALRPDAGTTWKRIAMYHEFDKFFDGTLIPADAATGTPAMTLWSDVLSATTTDGNTADPNASATIVNGAITAKMTHVGALLTIAPEAITIGGEFAKEGYTTIATLRASTSSKTDADNNAAGWRFPFTPMNEPVPTAAGNRLWQAIALGNARITTLHIRLARPDGTTSDEMEIAVKPDATDGSGNPAPGLVLTSNHRYKLKLSLYNPEAMKVEVPAEYPSWGEEEEIKNDIFFIKDATTLKAFVDAVNGGRPGVKGIVTADFTFNPVAGDDVWAGIGNSDNQYTGTFDGQGHTITFTNIDEVSYGLFSEVGTNGTVKNTTVSGAKVGNGIDVGAIVNYNNGGIITACYATDCTIYSYGDTKSGSVVGYNKGILTACSAMNCTTSSLSGGGVVGRNDGTTTACIAIGCNPNKVAAAGTTTACFPASTADGITADNIAAMNTALTAITPATYYRWIKDEKGTPKVVEVSASIAAYYLIYDAASLWKFHNIVNGLNSETLNAYLKAMVMTNFEFDPTTTGAWKGIGEYNYSGIFDGGGHTITFTKASDFGLFGTVKGRAKNITVKNCNTTAIGAIANTNTGILENCHAVSCTISGTSSDYDYTGGVVGLNFGRVYACSATDCKVKGSGSIGAVIGHYEDTINESGNPIPNAVIGCIGINCTNGNDDSPLNTIVGSSRSDNGSITIITSYAAPTAAGINNNDPNGAMTDMNNALAAISGFAWRWKYDSSATPAWSIIPKQ